LKQKSEIYLRKAWGAPNFQKKVDVKISSPAPNVKVESKYKPR
jgi:hypothetical protein